MVLSEGGELYHDVFLKYNQFRCAPGFFYGCWKVILPHLTAAESNTPRVARTRTTGISRCSSDQRKLMAASKMSGGRKAVKIAAWSAGPWVRRAGAPDQLPL